jgi:hypothetical protein
MIFINTRSSDWLKQFIVCPEVNIKHKTTVDRYLKISCMFLHKFFMHFKVTRMQMCYLIKMTQSLKHSCQNNKYWKITG